MPEGINIRVGSENIQVPSSIFSGTNHSMGTRLATGALSMLILCNAGAYSLALPGYQEDKQACAFTRFDENHSVNDVAYNINTMLSTGCVDMETKYENIALLNSFLLLEKNWDFYGANPIAPTLVGRAIAIVNQLNHQPDISPTARDSIQFEYNKENGDYLEFELFLSGQIGAFMMKHDGETREISVSFDEPQEINRVVDSFYGESAN